MRRTPGKAKAGRDGATPVYRDGLRGSGRAGVRRVGHLVKRTASEGGPYLRQGKLKSGHCGD